MQVELPGGGGGYSGGSGYDTSGNAYLVSDIINSPPQPKHTPSHSSWVTLSGLLPAGLPRNVYLNNLGENAPSQYPATKIANLIYQGAVWVDWCGWPLYSYGPDAATELLRLVLGTNVSPNWNMSDIAQKKPTNYFSRSLILLEPLPSPGIVNMSAPNGTASQLHYGFVAYGTRYWYSSFAVPYGRGAYIYAYGNDTSYTIPGIDITKGLSAQQYAPFISQVMNRLPAPVNQQPSPPSCPNYGTYQGRNTNGTYSFRKDFSGYYIIYTVDQNCNQVSGAVRHDTNTTPGSGGYSSGGSGGSSPPVTQNPPPGQNLGGIAIAGAGVLGAWYILRRMRG